MTRRSDHSEWEPGMPVGRRGMGRSYDPFYQFKRLARDDGQPYKPPEPKAELQLLALLSTRAALVAMIGVAVVVAFTLIVLVVARLG
jgi:hypothetical protein